jgi:hypothetical protein
MTALRKAFLIATCFVMPAYASACASSSTNAASAKQEPATVLVDNQALLDMTIYVVRGSQRLRLGTATGLSKTRMTIPASLVFGATSLRFQADPIGGTRAPVSEEITIRAGEEIGLMIPPG